MRSALFAAVLFSDRRLAEVCPPQIVIRLIHVPVVVPIRLQIHA